MGQGKRVTGEPASGGAAGRSTSTSAFLRRLPFCRQPTPRIGPLQPFAETEAQVPATASSQAAAPVAESPAKPAGRLPQPHAPPLPPLSLSLFSRPHRALHLPNAISTPTHCPTATVPPPPQNAAVHPACCTGRLPSVAACHHSFAVFATQPGAPHHPQPRHQELTNRPRIQMPTMEQARRNQAARQRSASSQSPGTFGEGEGWPTSTCSRCLAFVSERER